MFGKKKEWRKNYQAIACGLMTLSFLAVLAAGWGFVFSDLILASTQWLLVAAVLAVFGVYAKMEGE